MPNGLIDTNLHSSIIIYSCFDTDWEEGSLVIYFLEIGTTCRASILGEWQNSTYAVRLPFLPSSPQLISSPSYPASTLKPATNSRPCYQSCTSDTGNCPQIRKYTAYRPTSRRPSLIWNICLIVALRTTLHHAAVTTSANRDMSDREMVENEATGCLNCMKHNIAVTGYPLIF